MPSSLKKALTRLLPGSALVQKGPACGGRIYLTFDDGPHPENTPRLLEALAARGAKATFFVLGSQVEKHPEVARWIVRDGHEIAGHSWSHRRCGPFEFAAAREEFDRTRRVLAEVCGVDTDITRPPFGWLTVPMIVYALRGRMRLALWSVDSDDDRSRSADVILAKGRSVEAGDILLCHDDNEAILEALPRLLDDWTARGLSTGLIGEAFPKAKSSRG
jgi:peptidoglycan/xylan/chitin deacetylase (PgdA/CDA1 family)